MKLTDKWRRPGGRGLRQNLPVVLCPYLYEGEEVQIAAAFGIGTRATRHIEFCLWHDAEGIGPERAYEFLWSRYPDRDIVILHSDMMPMPGDPPHRWFDDLVGYARRFPDAGMLACNLFHPPAAGRHPDSVQCAGGTFDDDTVAHIQGRVVQRDDPAAGETGTVATELLEQVRAVPWVTFGGVFIRRAVLDACGPVDRRYRWAYVADVDYCFEARTRGFSLLQVPVSLVHEESRSTRAATGSDEALHRIVAANMERFHDKWQVRLGELPALGELGPAQTR